jgi:CrcB protein
MERLLLVAAGGAIGATLRYLSVVWFLRVLPGFPWGTLFVNVVGSGAMGVLAVVIMERMPDGWSRLAPFLMTGVLGGFTTFSAFSLDLLGLVERGRMVEAAGYLGGSVVLSVLALWAGLTLARSVVGS